MKRYCFILLISFSIVSLFGACGGGDDPIPDPTPVNPTPEPDPDPDPEIPDYPELDAWRAPTYADDYTPLASWNSRAQWNLANVHDPTVMRADDGYYYMYQTDASYSNAHLGHGHFHGRRSRDLVNWEYRGATMLEAPAWVLDSLNDIRARMDLPAVTNPQYGYWAPVARNVGGGKYRMYYSIVVNNYIKTGAPTSAAFDNSWTERAFIGMMETGTPEVNSSWVDKGYVVCSASDKGRDDWTRPNQNNWEGYFKFNAIDPTLTITPEGEHWLTYGSWHSGFATLQLDPATGLPLQKPALNPWSITDASGYGKLVARRGVGRWQASEAPEVVYNPETRYYYLFMAYDALEVPYNTRVARSRNVDGPYVDISGANAIGANELLPVVTHPYKFMEGPGWVGIAHCCVFDDGEGNWYYSSQGRLPHDVPGINASNAVMMGHVRAILWTADGWPLVMPERYAAVPRMPIVEAELTGDWEHIDLSYSYGNQKMAGVMTLGADHRVTAGTWSGSTWSYNAASQVLTIGQQQLYLARECDWEASPRKHTIVYAAYGTNNKTYWGKKK
ncbi:MAG: arabinan endo-1,5-alpha-L-arabinosidase [Mediterranea sp.]|jgi:beta-xylosidase|nr:arabinan endo-1,5-alpha-L-arabinosidase [Mediterranea sp.]